MNLDLNKTYLTWSGSEFPNSSNAQFKAPAGSTIDWGDGTVETFETASETVNTHTYTDGLTKHTIAISGLTSIDWGAFRECSSLTSVIIPDSVTIIGGGAFAYCDSLVNIHIPDGLTTIGTSAFNSCSKLTNMNILDSVTSIGAGGFYGCNNLMSVTIGNSVTSIGNSVFGGCTSLQSIVIFAETPPTLGVDAIPSNVQSIYVQQSSKAEYQAATNWNTFENKIKSNNTYLSLIKFNKKNKEYINKKVSDSEKYVDDRIGQLNIKNGTGIKSIEQVVNNGTNTTIPILTKNPNAVALGAPESVNVGAVGESASAFGGASNATGKRAHSEGTNTAAIGKYSHAEGDNSVALADDSHAEGYTTVSAGLASHAEGYITQATGDRSHSEGYSTKSAGQCSHAEGAETVAAAYASHAEGNNTIAPGSGSHAEGGNTISRGTHSHAEGYSTVAGGANSHSEGDGSTAEGLTSHSEGTETLASGESAHAEGLRAQATGHVSHAEGADTKASVSYSHAEGSGSESSGLASHSEGTLTKASGNSSHSEGGYTKAIGDNSHAEGTGTQAKGINSHAEGNTTIASGNNSHAEGVYTEALHDNSHAEGSYTKTSAANQHVGGQFNKYNSGALFIVGNGTSDTVRKNAFEVLGDGRAKLQSAPTEDNDIVRKVDLTEYIKKPTSSGIVKFNSEDGTSSIQSTYQSVPAKNQIPIAKNGGRITTNTPTDDLDCTNKKYVDDGFVARPTNAYGYNRLLGFDVSNNNLLINVMYPNYNYSPDDAPTRIGIPYMKNGEISCSIPTSDYSTANKKYVDDRFAVINLALEQSGLLKKYKQPIEQEYNERITADGLNVLDGSKAKLEKIVGNTVSCKQLLDESKISVGEFTDTTISITSVDGNTIKIGSGVNYTGNGLANSGHTLKALCPSLKLGETYYLNGENNNSLASASIFIIGAEIQWDFGTAKEITQAMLDGVVYLRSVPQQGGIAITITNLRITKEQNTPWQPYFTGLKSASFAGIESTNADGTETATLDFPKTQTPLGTTIDFETKKITDYGVDLVLTGTENWVFRGEIFNDVNQFYALLLGNVKYYFGKGVCTDFERMTGLTGTVGFAIGSSNSALYLSVPKTQITSVDDLKAWLAQRYADGNPVTVRYVSSVLQSETDFTTDNEYMAYKGGTEKVLDNDGAEYGADNTLTQDYILVTEVK